MKHIKQFESTENLPQKDDKILINIDTPVEDLENFINNTIGTVQLNFTKKTINKDSRHEYIRYENIPINMKFYFMTPAYGSSGIYTFKYEEAKIIAFGKNIGDIETMIDSNKYNL